MLLAATEILGPNVLRIGMIIMSELSFDSRFWEEDNVDLPSLLKNLLKIYYSNDEKTVLL